MTIRIVSCSCFETTNFVLVESEKENQKMRKMGDGQSECES